MWQSLTYLVLLLCCLTKPIKCETLQVLDFSNRTERFNITNEPIELKQPGNIIFYKVLNVEKILLVTNEPMVKRYLDAQLVLGESKSMLLAISTTPAFTKYAQEERATTIKMQIQLDCGNLGERILRFNQPILEQNYFKPMFKKNKYELALPTPVFAGFELTSMYDIAAKDNDLVKNFLTFEIVKGDQNFINVSTKNYTRDSGRIYYAKLNLNRIFMSLEVPIEFDLQVTDSGSPAMTDVTHIKIRGDRSINLPPLPKFERDMYNLTMQHDLTLKPFNVDLRRETFTNAVKFLLNGTDDKLFTFKSVKNSVKINLNSELTIEDIRYRNILHLNLIAENTMLDGFGFAKALIMIQVPNLAVNFNFDKCLYDGKVSESGALILEDIKFHPLGFSKNIQFTLNGTESAIFTLTQKLNVLKLTFSDNFFNENWNNLSHITLNIFADNSYLHAETCIHIEFLKKTSVSIVPQFSKFIYEGTITTNGTLTMEAITFAPHSFNRNETVVELSGNGNENFEFSYSEQGVDLVLLPSANVNQNTGNFHLLLTARTGNLKSRAMITIDIQKPSEAKCPTESIFKQHMLVGKILSMNATQELKLEPIQLKTNNADKYQFVLEGDYSDSFEILNDNLTNTLTLQLIAPIITQKLENKMEIALTINAMNKDYPDAKDTFIVFLHLPWKDCLHQLAAFAPTKPEFSSSEYLLTVKPNQVGKIGLISAAVLGNNGTIFYTLQVEDDTLKKIISIDTRTGELILLSHIKPGVYYFNVTATESISLTHSKAVVRLNVDAVYQCLKQELPQVARALIVKHIQEEHAYNEVLNVTLSESCSLAIADIQPNDKEYVYVIPETQMLAAIAIDRESQTFREMETPQINVELRIQCVGVDAVLSQAKRSIYNPATHMEDIVFSPDTTLLKLIIDDINDNAPEFVYPVQNMDVGYPAPAVRFMLFPENLLKISARDNDVGVNAEIQYSLSENNDFEIDPMHGTIYPKSNALEEHHKVELEVKATDGGDLSSELKLRIYRLEAEHYALLTVAEENLEDIVNQLVISTGMEFTLIKQARFPATQFENTEISRKFIEQAWIYVFNRNQPQLISEYQSKINEFYKSERRLVLVSSYRESLNINNPTNDTLGYIIALGFLTLLCITCITFLLYSYDFCFKTHRSHDIDHCDNRQSDTHESQNGTPSVNSLSTLPASQASSTNRLNQRKPECSTFESL